MSASKFLQKQNFWEESWQQHIEQYLAAPPRTGIWLVSRFSLANWCVLEIAGGSCRDARFLAEQGIDAIGSDFDQKTLDYLRQRFPQSPLKLRREDAMAISLPDKSVDLSMHNGFWVLFDDNVAIQSLLREQVRITRRVVVAIVHNAENHTLIRRFSQKAKTDQLYQIRFFNRAELLALVYDSGILFQTLRIEKFGGPIDLFLSLSRRLPLLTKGIQWLVPRLYRFQPWHRVERLALIIEI